MKISSCPNKNERNGPVTSENFFINLIFKRSKEEKEAVIIVWDKDYEIKTEGWEEAKSHASLILEYLG
jgi:uncharacterized alpha/beta hydrolase family protein